MFLKRGYNNDWQKWGGGKGAGPGLKKIRWIEERSVPTQYVGCPGCEFSYDAFVGWGTKTIRKFIE